MLQHGVPIKSKIKQNTDRNQFKKNRHPYYKKEFYDVFFSGD